MKTQIIKFLKDEEGATAIEYGLIAGLISIAILTAVTEVGTGINNVLGAVKDALTTASGSAGSGGSGGSGASGG